MNGEARTLGPRSDCWSCRAWRTPARRPGLTERKREIEAACEHATRASRGSSSWPPGHGRIRPVLHALQQDLSLQLQLESIVLKGKHLPDVSPAVDANFMAEVETLVLTAGHDSDKLRGALVIDVSRDGESMTQMNGTSRAIRPGDMIMRDAEGICCSIIYGQDARSPISPATSRVLYVAYAPAGIGPDVVERQLGGIEANLRLFSPAVAVEQHRVLTT
jgi:hypothetical protein